MDDFVKPILDWHAFAPEIVLVGALVAILVVDLVLLERAKPIISSIAGLGLLASLIPLLTLATSDDSVRTMFGGAYVVDQTSLVLKALFLLSAYVVVLLSTNYVAEGDYWESEYYVMLLSSVLGMTIIASARDLISIFIAIELLSIPAYMMATWRKRDSKSNEAGFKYYLMGVFASAIFLYGMSLIYGLTGTTLLSDIGASLTGDREAFIGTATNTPALTLAVVFVVIGFAFKVSAVPFHQWAPDTYEGAPTPVTAFLAVASKAAGFVALMQIIGHALGHKPEILGPLVAVLAILSMTVGNLIAIRQTNLVRMLAYSGIAQAGFMLAPLAVAGRTIRPELISSSIVTYLIIYAAMNLGAFAVVIGVARKTRSAEISSFGGLFTYAPAMTVVMTIFLASLTGIPPLAGWYAKFSVMNALIGSHSNYGFVLGVVLAINTAIAAYYYLNVAKTMWFDDVPDDDTTPIPVPSSLKVALAITAAATIIFGTFPGLITDASNAAETPAALIGVHSR